MKKIAYFLAAILLFSAIIIACGESKDSDEPTDEGINEKELHERASTLFATLPEVADSESNPVTDEKVELGKKLYFDKGLSENNNISCNSCHAISKFGVDNEPTSPGDKGKRGDRNSPTVFNAALHIAQFWDGRSKDVEDQAGKPIQNPVEMAMPSEDEVMKRLRANKEYQKMFKEAFSENETPVTFENMRKAIGAYERTLMTPGRFDEYLEGDTSALTKEEKEGMIVFMDKGCITCHTGNLLGGNMYQKFGVHYPYWEYTGSEKKDEGRFTVTEKEADKYVFKVPSLRNIAETWPYFHDGSIAELDSAVKIMSKVQLDKELTDEETEKIVTFLKALTGEIPESAYLEEEEMAVSK